MDAPSLKRAVSAVVIGLGGLLWLAAILFMAQTAQHSEQFSRLHPWILMINVAGLVVLVGLLGTKLAQLVRDWRGHVIGSRLKARMVWIFGVLATLPILLVYFFAVQFLNRGIDSWFNVEIRQSLDDALVLSRSALETRMREHLDGHRGRRRRARGIAGGERPGCSRSCAASPARSRSWSRRRAARIVAVSKGLSSEVVPDEVPGEVLLQVRQGRPFVSLEPQAEGGYLRAHRRAARPRRAGARPARRAGDLPGRRAASARWPTRVQAAYQQFGEKDYLRKPLKASFILTLTVVLLLSLLAAWYGAIFTAQRLVQPIQDLVKGTRAVAQGDLDTRLPLTSHDEMGFLVHSFNDMTKRLRRAREDQQRAQQAAETERANLAVILARLSTGVISLEPDLRVRTANRGGEHHPRRGPRGLRRPRRSASSASPTACCASSPRRAAARLAAGDVEWREQFTFQAGTVAPHPDVRLHAAAGRGRGRGARRLRARVRRHHADAAGAARGGVGRGGAAPRARDQEPAHAHPAVRRAHAPQAAAVDEREGRAAARPRHRDHRAAGRGDEGDGQRLQRVRARAALRDGRGRPQPAGDRGHRPLPRAGRGARRDARGAARRPRSPGWSADRGRLRQLLHNLLTNAVEALEGKPGGVDHRRDAARAAQRRGGRRDRASRTTGRASSAS